MKPDAHPAMTTPPVVLGRLGRGYAELSPSRSSEKFVRKVSKILHLGDPPAPRFLLH
jgi:hypothetical protein